MADEKLVQDEERGSSPASRGGVGIYIEGELGAFYLLAMLAGIPGHGLPSARIVRIRFQGTDLGYELDDLILYGASPSGDALLEIQSKRDITFAPRDAVYREVSLQIARSQSSDVAEERHFLGIATQRTSRKISGAYQDVLKWATAADTSDQFYKRLNANGVANADMREFVSTSRRNLVAGGVADDDETIWRILRRLLILEFDFESSVPLARTHAQMLARQVLADEDVARSDALWRTLIEISVATAATGGSLDREELRRKLVEAGFRLAGERDYGPARMRLADMARMTLAGIGTRVAGVALPRLEVVAALDEAVDAHRFVEVRGGPGVGKSWVLRYAAERFARQSPIVVLDPVATPPGGWIAFAQAFGIPGTASAFLTDLSASGGAAMFIDSLDMFTDPARQRTVGDLLRAASAIPGFTVITTSRTSSKADTEPWLDDAIIAAFGGIHPFLVSELLDAEVKILVEQAPELRVLLEASHPASKLARNLYRLSRLLKVPSTTEIRTEASLARLWWQSADGAPTADVRSAQRILAALAAHALNGESGVELQTDSGARSHLVGALTLKEVRRDQLDFYHDVLRDWAIGNYLVEDLSRLNAVDLAVPVSPRVARGIEFAGQLALESAMDCGTWTDILMRLSSKAAHSSWRRQVILAVVRSEAGFALLEKCSAALLAQGGTLLIELATTIAAVETVATVDIMKMPDGMKVPLPRSHRSNTTGTALRLLRWVLRHADEIPLKAIAAVAELVDIQVYLLGTSVPLAQPTTTMLFGWLRQLDVRGAKVAIPIGKAAGDVDGVSHRRMIESLRNMTLQLSKFAPEQLKAYLTEMAASRDNDKVRKIRHFSQVIAPLAPAELSALVLTGLIDKRGGRRHSWPMDRVFTFVDSDFIPPSPSQPPFLDLLEAAPKEGLKVIRTLVAEALAHYVKGREPDGDAFTLVFDEGARLFPWTDTYLWSRDQAQVYSAASGLKALEAWGHKRLDDGETVEAVLADILGPEESCAAYLLVAVDVLLSHFPQSRDKLGPFIGCLELLAIDGMRVNHDRMDLGQGLFDGNEPRGEVTLADLKARRSRQITLVDVLSAYLGTDPVAQALRARVSAAVEKLEPYEAHSTWVDPRFIGRFTRNMLDLANWADAGEGELVYQSPPDEAAHLKYMSQNYDRSIRSYGIEARIDLAIEGGDYATSETARIAAEYADRGIPDDNDADVLMSRSARLIATALLVARDGDSALLDDRESWVREIVDLELAKQLDRRAVLNDGLRFNRTALATLTLIHLWLRKGAKGDRNRLVQLAAHRDRSVAPAFAAALPKILEVEPRLFKAAMRMAFVRCLWRWSRCDEDKAEQHCFEAKQDAIAKVRGASEIVWLDGGNEPTWPNWPTELPILHRALRLRVPGPNEVEEFEAKHDYIEEDSVAPSNVHVDSRAGAQWLAIVNTAPKGAIDWGREVVEAYSGWTAKMNGFGLPVEAELDRDPAEWNLQYYALYTQQLMEAPIDRFKADLQFITRLPDEPFGDVAQTVIHASDVLYFNDPQCAAARPVELRTLLAERVITLQRWRYSDDPSSLTVDRESAGVVAKMLLNTYDPFNGTKSYLPAALSARMDPLLTPMRPLLVGGPMSFVALCIMNLLMVSPRARHLDFLLDATEIWFERAPASAFWTATGIGHQIVEWFKTVSAEQPTLLSPAHPERGRIDRLLGGLVSVGVAEAHELEMKVDFAAGGA